MNVVWFYEGIFRDDATVTVPFSSKSRIQCENQAIEIVSAGFIGLIRCVSSRTIARIHGELVSMKNICRWHRR